MNTIIASNRLDLDQARQNVGPDLAPNCLPRLTLDDKISSQAGKVFKLSNNS